ncbi:MAG: hypothetical protein FD160_1135 [Caulobacteraceae bacterium]|nr:MAG: hypothetical protein FD160_1135 [Caulobacteraceae bacterium]
MARIHSFVPVTAVGELNTDAGHRPAVLLSST